MLPSFWLYDVLSLSFLIIRKNRMKRCSIGHFLGYLRLDEGRISADRTFLHDMVRPWASMSIILIKSQHEIKRSCYFLLQLTSPNLHLPD